jgi:hypothetical protein
MRIITLILCIHFIIPLMIKEARVKNGLVALRYLLLAYGIIHTSTNVFSMYFLFDIINTVQKVINSWLQIINAGCFLALAIIGLTMYRLQYTEESKEHHRKISILERKEGKK